MKSVKHHLRRLPAFVLTAVALLLTAWLTLTPRPLGDAEPMLFPGADKCAHAILFGILTIAMMADRQRFRDWQKVSTPFAMLSVALATGIGAGIEFLQRAMAMGRTFEEADILADFGGSIVAALLYLFMQPRWSE